MLLEKLKKRKTTEITESTEKKERKKREKEEIADNNATCAISSFSLFFPSFFSVLSVISVVFLFFSSQMLNGATTTLPFVEIAQESNQQVMLEKAQQYHQKEVSIRGFLYQSIEGKWILSTEPNLKTCCIGSKDKLSKQILLKGNFSAPETSQPITITGLFIVEHSKDSPFQLEQPSLITKQPDSKNFLKIGLILCFVLTLAFSSKLIFSNKKKKKN